MFQHGVHSCRKYRARVTGAKVGECTGWRTEDQQQDRHCQHQSEKRMERGEDWKKYKKKKKGVQFAPELPFRLIIHFFSLFLRASTRKKSAAYKLSWGKLGGRLATNRTYILRSPSFVSTVITAHYIYKAHSKTMSSSATKASFSPPENVLMITQ